MQFSSNFLKVDLNFLKLNFMLLYFKLVRFGFLFGANDYWETLNTTAFTSLRISADNLSNQIGFQ